MREVDPPLLLVPLIHREIDDPAELEAIGLGEPKLVADFDARLASKRSERLRRSRHKEHGIAIIEPDLLTDRLGPVRADVLGDGTCALAFAKEDVAETRLAFALRPGIHTVAERAAAAALDRDRPDPRVDVHVEHAGEHLEARAPQMVGHVLHLDGIAQIRLVSAVFAHRLGIRNAREFLRDRLAATKLVEQPTQDRLDGIEHILLRDEAHLEVKLVELSGRTVSAGVLVAEAGRDLEIAVEARDHDELLELLRRLRQRVELAGMDPRRHEIVARPLWRGRGEDRRLELEEARLPHAVAQRPDDRLPLHDVGVQVLAPEIEEAVFEPRLVRIVRLAKYRQWQLF